MNTADAMTFASAGIPRDAEMYTYFGNVETEPELKFVMMKSSKLSANDSSAAARIPGVSNGNVTRQNTCDGEAYRSRPASSRAGSRLATRALTVTTTKLMQNIECARMIVVMSFGTPTA